jgi:hypothetical protein
MYEEPLMEACWEQEEVMELDRGRCEDERRESQDGKLFLLVSLLFCLIFFTGLQKEIQDLRAENFQFHEYLTNVFES